VNVNTGRRSNNKYWPLAGEFTISETVAVYLYLAAEEVVSK